MWNKILRNENIKACIYVIEMGQETKVSAMKSTLLQKHRSSNSSVTLGYT